MNNKFEKISKKIVSLKFFNEVYPLVLALIALLGWTYNQWVGMIALIVIAIIILIITNDMTYIIPNALYLLFCMSEGFSNSKLPILLIIVASIFIIVLLIFTIKNGIKWKKMKSMISLLPLAIINIIPILWNHKLEQPIETPNQIFYFLYFANFGYLILYILFVNGIKKANLTLLATSFSYLGLLLSFELAMGATKELGYNGVNPINTWWFLIDAAKNNISELFSAWYWLGWGLCNEAGIMICFSLPFVFYLLADSNNLKGLIGQGFKIAIMIIGVLLTTSRGSYLCMALIVVVSAISLCFISKNKKTYNITLATVATILILCFFVFYKKTFPIFNKIIESVFNLGFDNNGRTELWEIATNLWLKNPLYTIFGPGIVSALEVRSTPIGDQLVPIVYHSTIFETLALGGIIGIIVLGLHLYQKYKHLFYTNKRFCILIFIGFLGIDLYGLIDNTYHMYYFMIPLMLVLSTLDLNYIDKVNNSIF